MTTPKPEQLTQWREGFETTYLPEHLLQRGGVYTDRDIQHSWQGFLRAKTDILDSPERKLAKFAAMLLKAKTISELPNIAIHGGIHGDNFKLMPEIEATIEQLLKE